MALGSAGPRRGEVSALPLSFPVNLKPLHDIKSVFKTGVCVCVKSHALEVRKLSLEKTNITFPPEKKEIKFKEKNPTPT